MNNQKTYKIMIFGVGAFAHSTAQILKECGAEVYTYLDRKIGQYGPIIASDEVFYKKDHPNPCGLLKRKNIDFIVIRGLEWGMQEWTDELLTLNIPILCARGEGFNIEHERDYARRVCERYGVPFPKSFVAENKLQAERILKEHPAAYVLKNTQCYSTSPIRATVCETIEQTRSWLNNLKYDEGVFMQEYLGTQEAGHVAFVSHGEIYSILTNQEYKRAFNGNQGILAGAPLGGMVEADPDDKYHLAEDLLHPLLPWFREVNFHGPIQVTAFRHQNKWYTVEYNIRLGVTCGPMIMRMLKDPVRIFEQVATNQAVKLEFHEGTTFGCMLSLAGYGYPYTQIQPPQFFVHITNDIDCDVWWNEVDRDEKGNIVTSEHRIADIVAMGRTSDEAITQAYRNIKKISCPGSYYRTDIGELLWPPKYD
ncbi:MAG: phosphoribosylamine--glycine ligase [bacterium]|nr:phosphoribosylamine--glycine ligase [bacterium]